jgi:hypothetical protein
VTREQVEPSRREVHEVTLVIIEMDLETTPRTLAQSFVQIFRLW